MSEFEKSETPAADSEELELKLPGEASTMKELALWAGVLALLTLIAYWPATTGAFIWRDDATAAKKELLVPAGLSQSWFGRWQSPQTFDQPVYRPVADSAYWLEYRLGGHDERNLPAPTTFHVASLIFHASAGILLWLILRELLIPGAWVVAAIFALHPIHSESISWISEQPAVLSGLLFLGSVHTYLMFIKSREQDKTDRAGGGQGVDPAQTWGLYGGSAVLCLGAMLSEPSAMVLPVVILLLLWWKKRFTSQDSLLLIPLLVIGLALWFADVDLHKTAGGVLLNAPLLTQVGTIGRGLWHTGIKLIAPFGFSALYSRTKWDILFTVLAGLTLAKMAGGYLLRKQFGAGLFVATAMVLLLVIFSVNWFDASRLANITDGTSYLAIIPLIVIVVAWLSGLRLPGPHPQNVVGVSALVLIVLGALSWQRTYAFESSVALWSDVLRKDPRSSFAEASLAEQLRLAAIEAERMGDQDAVKEDLKEAVDHAYSALQLDGKNGQAQRTWANVLVSQGDIASAVPHFELAMTLDPTSVQLRDEYASALIELGRFKDALPPLDQALVLDVNSATTHRLLGQAYGGLGDTAQPADQKAAWDRAIGEQTMALELEPGDLIARQKLAEVLAKSGRLKEAIADYAMLMQADQNRPELWRAVAKIKDQQGEYAAAVQYLQTAVRLAREDKDLEKELDSETKRQAHAAATRAATMPATTRAVQ